MYFKVQISGHNFHSCNFPPVLIVLVVVDLSDEGSLDMAGTWKRDVLNNCVVSLDECNDKGEKTRRRSIVSQVQIPILLVGNKLDKVYLCKEGFRTLFNTVDIKCQN